MLKKQFWTHVCCHYSWAFDFFPISFISYVLPTLTTQRCLSCCCNHCTLCLFTLIIFDVTDLGPINSYEFPAPFATVQNDFTLMAWCWTIVAPLLMHWSCCSLALPGLRLDVHYALCQSCKNYASHWRVSFLCFNELMLRDYSAISHWFCICLCVTVAIKTSWIFLNLESESTSLLSSLTDTVWSSHPTWSDASTPVSVWAVPVGKDKAANGVSVWNSLRWSTWTTNGFDFGVFWILYVTSPSLAITRNGPMYGRLNSSFRFGG